MIKLAAFLKRPAAACFLFVAMTKRGSHYHASAIALRFRGNADIFQKLRRSDIGEITIK
jgi:hypothetical protein